MVEKIEQLFEEQIASWPMLARGVAALTHAQTRPVDVNGYTVYVRHLPHRIASTTAAVDAGTVANRPCFLCAANLPPEEKGIAFNSEYTIYCNPFPILDRHLTIVHRDHRPQAISGQLRNMEALAQALPGYFVVYNGPECGASAPDHLHFQACSAALFPIAEDLKKGDGRTIPNYARNVLVFRDLSSVEAVIGDPEPMINIAAFRDSNEVVFLVFPRSKHRPAVFHTGEFTVSPASIDLCGVFVTPVEKDFQRITGEDIRRIYEEVTLWKR
jgi:ATP adenylyltransferase/5',5'''-P-1,P-4-tetraphosphate phosphorylase II